MSNRTPSTIHEDGDPPSPPTPSTSSAQSANDTLTVKLRNPYASPPTTQSFTLPRSRAIATSAYLREHIESPSPHNKDDIIRINFPKFKIFEIYAEWLRSGEVLTKAALHSLRSNSPALHDPSESEEEEEARENEEATRIYTDYLSCYFLGSWLRDTPFKDTIVSLIISRINASQPASDDEPRAFLRSLIPSVINVVFMDETSTQGLRNLIHAAVVKWGSEEDVDRWLPETASTCERGFLRGLLGALLRGVQSGGLPRVGSWEGRVVEDEDEVEESSVDDENSVEDDISVEEENSIEEELEMNEENEMEEDDGQEYRAMDQHTTMPTMPPPFMPPPSDLWSLASRSDISWPSTVSDNGSVASSHATPEEESVPGSDSRSSAYDSGDEVPTRMQLGVKQKLYAWPEKEDEYCAFHEHGRLGMECWMTAKTGRTVDCMWDGGERPTR